MKNDRYVFICDTRNKSRSASFVLDNLNRTFKRTYYKENNPDAIADTVSITLKHYGKGGFIE